jgi:membrane protease YdiL (CAAX protease family)
MIPLTADPEPSSGRAEERLGGICVLVWILGALASHRLGIWAGVGGVGLALGAAVLLRARRLVAPLLVPAARPILVGLLAGGLMVSATYLLYPPAGRWVVSVPEQTAGLYRAFSGPAGLVSLLLLPPVILAEELVWRGAVQTVLCRRLGPMPAAILTVVAYALAHAPAGSPLLTFVALACGLYWSLLRLASRSLLAPLLAHLLWDLALLVFWPLVPIA